MEADDGPPRSQREGLADGRSMKSTTASMEEVEETAMSVDAEFERLKGLHYGDSEEHAKPSSQPPIRVRVTDNWEDMSGALVGFFC